MTQTRPPSATALLIASLAAATAAEPVVAPQPPAGDEIMLFSELPEVVSASRQKTSLSGAAVAISVVQAEQLHADRLRSLPEVLRRLPGMDVLDIDRGHVAVGVRGLHGLFSDRTLVLLDGIPFENVSLGGADWHRLPVGVGDLERIEVVRGPASAAWGANALNGVINLITAPPEDRLGTSVTVGADQWGDALGAISIAELSGQTAWRLSGGYRDLRSSAETADVDSSAGDDAARTGRVAFDMSTPTALGALTAMAGWSGGEVGSYEFIGYDPNRPVRIDSLRSQIRLNSGGRDDALATSVILHGHYDRVLEPQLVDRGETWRIGTTAQVDIDGGMGHRVTLGCDGDTTRVSYTTGDDREEFTFGGPFQEWRVGLFGIDRWNLGSGFTSELQLRGERYTGTGNDWGGRATILYDVAGDQRHVLRVGGARAYRTPYPSLRQGVANRGWINVPGFGSLSVIGLRPDPGGVTNERVWSVEAGYTGRLSDRVLLRLDAYWMRYQDLLGAEIITRPTPVPGVIYSDTVLDNYDGARALGGEVELTWTGELGRVGLWYAFNEFVTDRDDQAIRAFQPARHKVGATARAELPANFAATGGYRFATATYQDPVVSRSKIASVAEPIAAQAFHRIDLELAWAFDRKLGEVAVGVDDLFNQTPTTRSTGSFQSHAVPGRTIYLRAGWLF